jgi:hypothetical protein
MPELAEEEKHSQSSDTSPPSSVAFEKTNFSPNDSTADSVGTGTGDDELDGHNGSCQNCSPIMSSCSEEYTPTTKPQHSTETEDINAEFSGDDKLE